MGGPIKVPNPTTANPWPFLVPTLLMSFVKVVNAAGKMPWNPATKNPNVTALNEVRYCNELCRSVARGLTYHPYRPRSLLTRGQKYNTMAEMKQNGMRMLYGPVYLSAK